MRQAIPTVSSHPAHCCPVGPPPGSEEALAVERRDFLKIGALALGGLTTGLVDRVLADADPDAPAPGREPLTVLPILMYEVPVRKPQTSWRNWGGIATEADAQQEKARIQGEVAKLQSQADFPLRFLPTLAVREPGALTSSTALASADAILLYAAGGRQAMIDAVAKSGKPAIVFIRHRSGPLSLWYEIISPRYLHQHGDVLASHGIDNQDVVIDSLDEVLWRLRSLTGLKNTLGAKVVAIGGASGWAHPEAPSLAKSKFRMETPEVSYKTLGELIETARNTPAQVASAKDRAHRYLQDAGVKLETEKPFVENAFLLEQVLRGILKQADARMLTINQCMGTIMPMAQTTACLTLSLLNDAGYLAFCESDFVVIPSGVLLHGISGKPQFLNDPTYPHGGMITLAHCTAPRKLDGKTSAPTRLVTHFESDYGAAPKVEMREGQKVTNVIPDFKFERWTGFVGKILESPFLPICRSQIEVGYTFPDAKLAENMPGFHWMTCYGDYEKELAYALKRIPIRWDNLGA